MDVTSASKHSYHYPWGSQSRKYSHPLKTLASHLSPYSTAEEVKGTNTVRGEGGVSCNGALFIKRATKSLSNMLVTPKSRALRAGERQNAWRQVNGIRTVTRFNTLHQLLSVATWIGITMRTQKYEIYAVFLNDTSEAPPPRPQHTPWNFNHRPRSPPTVPVRLEAK
jgi:hypothetical protein